MDTSTLHDMWDTRPVRRRTGNTIGGVCAGIGDRYRVDPTLVKVAFVVSALFGGSGVLIYLAALIALPADDEARPARRTGPLPPWARLPHAKWIPMAVLAVIGIAIVASSNTWGSSGLLSAALMAGGWWLLYQRTPVPPEGTAVSQLPGDPARDGATVGDPTVGDPAAASVAMPPTAVGDGSAPTIAETRTVPASLASGDDAPTARSDAPSPGPSRFGPTGTDPRPPSWDPLGTARFAWDLPEPVKVAPVVPRSPVTPVFAGLAVMAATAGTAARLAGVDWFTPGRIASLALAVLGVGLIVAALQRRPSTARGSGLVPLAVIAAVAVLAVTAFTGAGRLIPGGGVGEREWSPQSVAELRDDYSLTVGNSTVDLRGVGVLDRDRTVTIRQAVGEIVVRLPENVRVRTRCDVTVGDVTCPDGVVDDSADTPTLTVDAHVTVGSVEMK